MEAIEIRWWEAEGNPNKADIIEKIERRSKQDVFELLRSHGIAPGKRNQWREYSKAKKICFEGMFINCEIYDQQISWILDFQGRSANEKET
jgi:hypothetical protein